jgi:hypothetical protein
MNWQKTGFIQRARKITGAGFAQTLVLGGLAQPAATRKQLHHSATQAGMAVSVQGLDQRFTAQASARRGSRAAVCLANGGALPARPATPESPTQVRRD